MAGTFRGIIDWEKVGKNTNLDEVVRVLPPERVIEVVEVVVDSRDDVRRLREMDDGGGT